MFKTLTLPLLATLFMHGLILAIILIGAPETKLTLRKTPVRYIDAKLITLDKPKAKPEPKAKPKAAPRFVAKNDQEEKRKEREQRQQAQQRLAQQKAKAEAKKKQQLAEQQREQQRLAEQQQRLREQQKQELAEQIQQEAEAQQAASDAELASSYVSVIKNALRNNWSRPPSARNNMQVEMVLQLVPTGDIVGVRVTKSSGNAAFDRSAEQAVLRAERFPELQKLPPRVFEKYFRHLNLVFKPEDLRL